MDGKEKAPLILLQCYALHNKKEGVPLSLTRVLKHMFGKIPLNPPLQKAANKEDFFLNHLM